MIDVNSNLKYEEYFDIIVYQWILDGGTDYFNEYKIEIETHACSSAELGLINSEKSKFYP